MLVDIHWVFKNVSAKMTSKLKKYKQPHIAAVVENDMARMISKEDDHVRHESIINPAVVNYSPATIANSWHTKVCAKKTVLSGWKQRCSSSNGQIT